MSALGLLLLEPRTTMPALDQESLTRQLQEHFTDGLVTIIGSGLSCAEGILGMPAIADHLHRCSSELSGNDAKLWQKIKEVLDTGAGLEAALLKRAPTTTLERWIATRTAELLVAAEREVIQSVIRGQRTLRLTQLLQCILKPANGLPILTPNYDRLIEVACEMAGLHVDTTAVGHYAGSFDHARSCMASCRGVVSRGRTPVLDHFPRAIVLKPHGSLDWYRNGSQAIRCTVDIELERLIITPGLNKYRAGYNVPFDRHRELANGHIDRSARLLIVGYGFNDDHLQTHLEGRIREGTPTAILTRTASKKALMLASSSPNCVCLSKASTQQGTSVVSQGGSFTYEGVDLWDISILAKKVLA